MLEFKFSDSADQKLSVILNQRRVTLRFRENAQTDRLSLDVSIDGDPVMHGRKMLSGSNLLHPLNNQYNLGRLFVYSPWDDPTLQAFVTGAVKLYYLTEEEVADIDAAVA